MSRSVSDDDCALILDHAPERVLRQHLASQNYYSVVHDGLHKAMLGITSFAEVRASGLGGTAELQAAAPALAADHAPGPRPAATIDRSGAIAYPLYLRCCHAGTRRPGDRAGTRHPPGVGRGPSLE